jgi:hypothetical protein
MIYDQILKAENLSSMDPAIFIQKMCTFLILLKGNTEEVWYARLDLNQRSSAPEADALSPGPRAQKQI